MKGPEADRAVGGRRRDRGDEGPKLERADEGRRPDRGHEGRGAERAGTSEDAGRGSPPQRLLFFVNDAAFFLSHRLPIGRAAREAGFEVHLLAPGEPAAAARVEAEGIRFHPLPMSRSGARPWEELATFGRVLSAYRAVRPDLVHHVGFKPIFHGTLATLGAGRPPVVNAVSGLGHMFSVDRSRERLARRVLELGYRIACRRRRQRVIVQNPDDRALFARKGLARPDDLVLIPGSGVDPRRFRPRPERRGPPVVLLASRLLWTKGVGEFVEAARRLRAEGVEARFVLAGRVDPGNLASVQDADVREWEREGAVEWWGWRDDMPEVLTAAHVVCLPSHYREGVPRILIEAAAAGRPIVTTDAPGCREVVRHEVNGLLVPPRDPAAVARAVTTLLESPEARRSMGERGREIVLAEFTLERVVGDTLAVYGELLGRPTGEVAP